MFKILAVDSDKKYLNELIELLSEYNYIVRTESNFNDAKQALSSSAPDLILCELATNEDSVFEFLDFKQKSKEFAQIPLIIISVNTTESVIRKSMNHGADDFLSKPFVKKDLLLTITVRLKKYMRIKQIEDNLHPKC